MAGVSLHPAHEIALARAMRALEETSFAARLADYAGQPINKVLRVMPRRVSARVTLAVEVAVRRGVDTAVGTLDLGARRRPRTRLSSALAGVSGGVGGFFGVAALPIELPLTTLLMLRAIADIARHQGEDLTGLEARLACLQVFALGSRTSDRRTDVGYFASRALVSRLSNDAAALIVERGVAGAAGPMVNGLVAEIVSRFGVTVADRVAVSAVPVLGAIGGAAVNAVFMDHYQRVAKGHFTVRRLERRYGPDVIRRAWTSFSPGDTLLAPAAKPGGLFAGRPKRGSAM